MSGMRFEAMLGFWAFVAVCTTVVIVIVSLKLKSDKEEKALLAKKQTEQPK
jgi:hypothetical protein